MAIDSKEEDMRRPLTAKASRWMAVLAAAAVLSLSFGTAAADSGRKGHRGGVEKHQKSFKSGRQDHRSIRRDHRAAPRVVTRRAHREAPRVVYREHREAPRVVYREHRRPAPRVVYRDHHRPAPRIVYRDTRHVHSYPVWASAPVATCRYDGSDFFFHAGFDMFFDGGAFSINVGNYPPAGYFYVDPYCDASFYCIDDYRYHLAHYHHRPLVRLVAIEEAPPCW